MNVTSLCSSSVASNLKCTIAISKLIVDLSSENGAPNVRELSLAVVCMIIEQVYNHDYMILKLKLNYETNRTFWKYCLLC